MINSRRMRWIGLVTRMRQEEGKPEVNKQLGRPRSIWEDKGSVDLR
jgi:hypothetical protein